MCMAGGISSYVMVIHTHTVVIFYRLENNRGLLFNHFGWNIHLFIYQLHRLILVYCNLMR